MEKPKGAATTSPEQFLLTAKQISAMPGELITHFLNPNATRINKSLGDAVGLSQIGVHLIEVAPGKDSTEYQMHWYEEECVFVLSGNGIATLGDCDFDIGPGDFLGLPRHTIAHTIVNRGQEPLRCLVMGQRLAQDVGDYPRQGKRLYRNRLPQQGAENDLVEHEQIQVAHLSRKPIPDGT